MKDSSDRLSTLSDLLTRHVHEEFCSSIGPASGGLPDVTSIHNESANTGGVISSSEMLEVKKGKKCLVVTITDKVSCSLITLSAAGDIYFDKLPLPIEIKPQIHSDENSIPFSFYKGREEKKWRSCYVDDCDKDIWNEHSFDVRINCSFGDVADSEDFQNAIVTTVRKAAKNHEPDVCVLCFSETDSSKFESSISEFTRKFLKTFPDIEHAIIEDASVDADSRVLLWNTFNTLDQFSASQGKDFLTYDHNSEVATCYSLRINQFEVADSLTDLDGPKICAVLHFNFNGEGPLPKGHFQVLEDSHQRAMGHFAFFTGSLSADINEQFESQFRELDRKLDLYVRTNQQLDSDSSVIDGLYAQVLELQVT